LYRAYDFVSVNGCLIEKKKKDEEKEERQRPTEDGGTLGKVFPFEIVK